jgi:hypothetical protein
MHLPLSSLLFFDFWVTSSYVSIFLVAIFGVAVSVVGTTPPKADGPGSDPALGEQCPGTRVGREKRKFFRDSNLRCVASSRGGGMRQLRRALETTSRFLESSEARSRGKA